MVEPIFKYQYLIDKLIKYKKYIHSHAPNAIYIILKKPQVINWYMLSTNPYAIKILEKNIDKINWAMLSSNPNAIHLLENNLDKISWHELSRNPNAIHLLEKNIDKIQWSLLSTNPNGIELLKAHPDKINWYSLVSNTNPNAIYIIEKNLDKLDDIKWGELSKNPNAIHLLENNLDKINWEYLASNPKAIHIIENYVKIIQNSPDVSELESYIYHKISYNITKNTEAIALIKNNIGVINYRYMAENCNGLDIILEKEIKDDILSPNRQPNWAIMEGYENNSSLFDLDYITMAKKRSKILYYELIEKAFAPSRISKFLDYHLSQGYDINEFSF